MRARIAGAGAGARVFPHLLASVRERLPVVVQTVQRSVAPPAYLTRSWQSRAWPLALLVAARCKPDPHQRTRGWDLLQVALQGARALQDCCSAWDECAARHMPHRPQRRAFLHAAAARAREPQGARSVAAPAERRPAARRIPRDNRPSMRQAAVSCRRSGQPCGMARHPREISF